MPRKTNIDASARINSYALPVDVVNRMRGDKEPAWRPLSKFHEDILTVDVDEVLVWGAKASGKSSASRIKAMRGRVPTVNGLAKAATDENGNLIPWYMWQCWHPKFRGLVIRESSGDLNLWYEEFLELAMKIGGVGTRSPLQIRWPFGGITDFGHVQDESSWRKYVGNERHMCIWEEAVTVADSSMIDKLVTCLRSSLPDQIGVQLLNNCNPLGPGLGWICDRYYKIPGTTKDEIVMVDGVEVFGREIVVKPKQVITRKWQNKEGGWDSRTYTALFGTLKDNPVMDTPQYRATLMKDPRYRRAYMEGIPDFESGTYFKSFRDTNLPGEPPEACHVWTAPRIESILEPWYPVWVGVDWGFNHNAVATICHGGANGRVYVLDEYLQRELSVDEMGFQVGRRIAKYLARGQYVTIYMPHDTFAKESEIDTEAKRFMAGLSRATDGRVFDASREKPPAEDEPTPDQPERRGMAVIKRAINRRQHGASRITSLLRWQTFLAIEDEHPFADVDVDRLTDEGMKRYEAYRKAVAAQEEVLPKLIISENCPNAIDALKKAPIDPKDSRDVLSGHWAGADSYDSLRYALESVPLRDLETPAEVIFERKLAAIAQSGLSPMSKHMAMLKLEEQQADPDGIYGAILALPDHRLIM